MIRIIFTLFLQNAIGCLFNENETPALLIDKKTEVCTFIGKESTENLNETIYLPAQLRVDDFSRISLNLNSTSSSFDLENSNFIHFGVQKESTIFKKKLFLASQYSVTQITVVIELDEGNVDSIYFDDGCFSCSKNCFENAFDYSSNSVSVSGRSSGKDCFLDLSSDEESQDELSIYFVWKGTDKDGKTLSSYNKRLSNFYRFSVSSLTDFF
eukprot:snap_masked-scaffold_3-processed-gene-15.55-mRNA-1 protein AED:1.00 eAED:1.00 QI:0/-1/0/0/-1/1/1/0/211